MKNQIAAVMLGISLIFCDTVAATPQASTNCKDQKFEELVRVYPSACFNGSLYQIRYNQKSTSILLKSERGEVVLQRIPRKYDPSLVGADGFIGFLPNAMQAYKDKGVLAFVSSIRTKGGNGSGQCSAGAEIFLNFLDVEQRLRRFYRVF